MAIKKSMVSSLQPLILLVEDNLITLRLIETLINQLGFAFISATTAEEAFDLVKQTSFKLIITDLGLPGMSGIDLTFLIREWEISAKREAVPIVGLTAQTLKESERKCLQAGMSKLISKPIYLKEMQELMNHYL